MKIFEHKPENDPALESKQAALETIDEFFHIFHLVEAQEELDMLQHAVLKVPEFAGQKGEDIVYFCQKLKALINAAHKLNN